MLTFQISRPVRLSISTASANVKRYAASSALALMPNLDMRTSIR
jgi:hypothetical protein